MAFFKSIADLMPSSGTVQIAISKRGDLLTVSILPTFEDKDCRLMPLTATDTPESLDIDLPIAICRFTPSVKVVSSTLEQAKLAAEAKAAEIKANADKKSKNNSKPHKATPVKAHDNDHNEDTDDNAHTPTLSKEERKNGASDPAHIAILTKESSVSPEFLSTLTAASAQTMLDALNVIDLVDVKTIGLITMELADVVEKSNEEIQRGILSHKYKHTQNGVQAKIGKALEELTGQKLEDLGLAPKQFTLM